MMHKIHSGNPPDNFKRLFTPWNKFIPTQPAVLHEERSSGKQHQVNMEKDL